MPETTYSRREFLATGTAALAGAALLGHTSAAAAPSSGTSMIAANSAEIRLLQFTDLHFFAGISHEPEISEIQRQQTFDDMRRLVDLTRPDLLAVTGDFWHENPDGRGLDFLHFSVEKVVDLGIPWVFTWGNHDHLDDYDKGHKALAQARHSLYGGTSKNEGHYVTRIKDRSDRTLLELFCFNTEGRGVGEGIKEFLRQTISQEQSGQKRPMRLGAFHIPLRQYRDVWENGGVRGVKGEDICFEEEDGSALQLFREAGIQAVICGHDHINDYSGFAEGVELIYGRASGYNGYGNQTLRKGAKLYRIDPATAALHWESYLPDGTRWHPGPTERRNIAS